MKPKTHSVMPCEVLAKWIKEVDANYPYYVVLEIDGKKTKAILCSYELFERINKKLCQRQLDK